VRARRPWALAAPVVAGVGFALYAGGDWMPGSRYLVPYVPLIAALGALGLDVIAERLRLDRPALIMGLAALGAWLGSATVLWHFTQRREEHPFHVMSARDCLTAARAMRARLPPGARVVAYRIGALGWAGDFDVIDLLGLADRRIARIVEAHPEYHPRITRMGEDVPELRDYVASRDPQALLVTVTAVERLGVSCERYGRRWRLDQTYPQGSDERWALYVPESDRQGSGQR
jgi:hypothetical protein